MSVTAIIDRIVPYADGWDRTGIRSLLKLIERGQDELLEFDGKFNRFIDYSDNKGFPSYLQTTAGTYKYDITAANLSLTSLVKNIGGTDYAVRCKKILRVFRDVSDTGYGTTRWIGQPFVFYKQNPYTTQTTRLTMSELAVDSSPALEDTDAYVGFLEDPATTTETYFVEFTWEAPRLSSESIPLCVPLVYEAALEDYAMGRIKELGHGDIDNPYMQKFRNFWIPRFRSEIATGGASHNPREVQSRYC